MTEPLRVSLHDIMMRTFKLTERVTYIHRIIYCAEHTFSEENEKPVEEVMERIVNKVNTEFCFERLTGLFLYYTNYFVHILDGSEDSIMKHFDLLVTDNKEFLGRMKILVVYHHCNQRFFSNWAARTAKPPTLLEKIDPESDAEETWHFLDICISKVYTLSNLLRNQQELQEQSEELFISSQTMPTNEPVKKHEVGTILDSMAEFLPEYSLLDFLLGTPYLDDVSEYYDGYLKVPEVPFVDYRTWPVKADLVPRDVFDVEQELIPDLKRPTT